MLCVCTFGTAVKTKNMRNINEYVDFNKMFSEMVTNHLEYMVKHREEQEIYDRILLFHYGNHYGMDIDINECMIGEDSVIFVFNEEYQTANESDNQNGWRAIDIIYDIHNEDFTSYEEEAG